MLRIDTTTFARASFLTHATPAAETGNAAEHNSIEKDETSLHVCQRTPRAYCSQAALCVQQVTTVKGVVLFLACISMLGQKGLCSKPGMLPVPALNEHRRLSHLRWHHAAGCHCMHNLADGLIQGRACLALLWLAELSSEQTYAWRTWCQEGGHCL